MQWPPYFFPYKTCMRFHIHNSLILWKLNLPFHTPDLNFIVSIHNKDDPVVH